MKINSEGTGMKAQVVWTFLKLKLSVMMSPDIGV